MIFSGRSLRPCRFSPENLLRPGTPSTDFLSVKIWQHASDPAGNHQLRFDFFHYSCIILHPIKVHFAEIGPAIVPQSLKKRISKYRHFSPIEGIGIFGDEIPMVDIDALYFLRRNGNFVIRPPDPTACRRARGTANHCGAGCFRTSKRVRRLVHCQEHPSFREFRYTTNRFNSFTRASIFSGLVMCPFIPAFKDFSLSSSKALAEKAMIFSLSPPGSFLRMPVAS